MGINLLPNDAHGDTIMIATIKANGQPGTWTLTRNIRIRFSSARAVISAYQQQKTQQHNRNTQAERLLTYDGKICHTLIPSGHTNEESQDPSLHRVYASSQMFRGRDSIGIRALFIESMQAHSEALLDNNGNQDYTIPNEFYTAISNAVDYASDAIIVELHSPELLYMF